jgi:chromosome segregation ATPase
MKEREKAHEAAVKGLEEDIEKIKAERADLRNEMDRVRKEIDLCLAHNARLCVIAQELVEKYKEKGVVEALMNQEPLTQIEKVELERFLQEYEQKIRENNMEPQKTGIAPIEGKNGITE